MLNSPSPYERYLRNCQSGLRLRLRLGSPRLPDCGGIGICRMEMDTDEARDACPNSLTAYCRLDEPTGRLLLHIDSDTLTPKMQSRHFRGGYLRIPLPFVVPAWVQEWLEVGNTRPRIPAGNYPVLDDGTFLTVSLPLRERNHSVISHRLRAA